MECVFCGIVAGQVPANIVYQDEKVVAFPDINPQAPKHLLLIPKVHISSLAELSAEQAGLMGHLIHVAIELAGKEGMAQDGYRLVINCGRDGGQVVPHLHLHLLGGRRLSDRMG